MQAIVTDGGGVVCPSVTIVSPAKTAEPIEILFGLCTLVGPRNYVLDGIQFPLCQGAKRRKGGAPL